MDNEKNTSQAKELAEKLDKQKQSLSIFAFISLGLLSFIVICVFLMLSWGSSLSNCWPFFLLAIIDMPLLWATWMCFKTYRKMKDEQTPFVNQDSSNSSYFRNRQLLEQERSLKTTLIICPIAAMVLCAANFGMIAIVLPAVAFVICLRRYKNIKNQIAECNIPESERADFKASVQKNNKVKWILIIAILLIWAIASSSTGGNRTRRNPDEPSGEPWKELGVTKKEYMEIYNRYKYGE